MFVGHHISPQIRKNSGMHAKPIAKMASAVSMSDRLRYRADGKVEGDDCEAGGGAHPVVGEAGHLGGYPGLNEPEHGLINGQLVLNALPARAIGASAGAKHAGAIFFPYDRVSCTVGMQAFNRTVARRAVHRPPFFAPACWCLRLVRAPAALAQRASTKRITPLRRQPRDKGLLWAHVAGTW